MTVGPESNRGYRQPAGEVALRLAPTEIFLIDSLTATGVFIDKLNQAWSWGAERPRKLIGYPMPRADSHGWFALSGKRAPEMFAKICGIDLRLDKFAERPDRPDLHRQDERDHPAPGLGASCRSSISSPTAPRRTISGIAWSTPWTEFEGAPVGLAALRGFG